MDKTSERYSTVAIVLHWTIAAVIVIQLGVALRMGGPLTEEKFALLQLHKSIGVTILLLSLVRLGWRLLNPPPALPWEMATWERWLARITHVGLYVVMIGMPLTGWIAVSASKIDLPIKLYGLIPWPRVPGLAHLNPDTKALWASLGGNGHIALAVGLLALLALHIAGALKHQLFSKDEAVLDRMAPGAEPGRWLEPRLFAIAGLLAVASAIGLFAPPPNPHLAMPAPAVATATAEVSAGPDGWIVDPGGELAFTTAWGKKPVKGVFAAWKPDIHFNRQTRAAKIIISIDLASARTGDPLIDSALPAPEWLNVAGAAKAVFTADAVDQTKPGAYVAHGRLTLRGQSQPMDVRFELRDTSAGVHVFGDAVLDRTTFGVGVSEPRAKGQVPDRVLVGMEFDAHSAP